MSITPTGHLSSDRRHLQWERTLDAPVEELWAAITVSERLSAWIGIWTGDPSDGFVAFTMTAEEGDATASRCEIVVCEPPRRLAVVTASDVGSWHLELDVDGCDGGGSTVTMRHLIDDPAGLENIGPGWEYYLDRLVAAETGGDPTAITWEDYYPAQRDHYQEIAATLA